MNSNKLGWKWSCLNRCIKSIFVWRHHVPTKATGRRTGIQAEHLLKFKPKTLPADQPAWVCWHQTTYVLQILFFQESTKHSSLLSCRTFTVSHIYCCLFNHAVSIETVRHRMISECGDIGGMIIAMAAEILGKGCPSSVLSTTKPTWSDKIRNLDSRDEKPATDHLNYDIAEYS